jgi:two-component system, cell cycle sensor histidine kinase and response regulator CckA
LKPARKQHSFKDRKFHLLFEEHPQPMWVFDRNSRCIVEANAAAAALYGYSREEFRGLPLSSIQVGDDSTAAGASRSHRTKSGRVIEVDSAAHGFPFGSRAAELVVLLDVTGRRQLEEQLRQAQKMEAVGMLAGGVAHDFNNLLTIIAGYSQLILNTLPAGDPNRSSAEQIMKASDRAATLTGQLLAFSRRQVLQPKVLDLNRLTTSLTSMLRRVIGEDIDLRLDLRKDLGQVSADPGQIEQVLMNLVVNARDAMPHGGTMTVETANVQIDETFKGRHMSVKPGAYTMLAVSDTGTGMDETTQARLFEPFFTTKGSGRGTGLGLSTVFGIVKQSGGGVEVYSVPSKGTSIKVYLPRIDQPLTADPVESRGPEACGTETILLVEDDEMVRTLVRETLARGGYKVLDAPDPVEAKKISDAFRGRIHLLITDVVLPKVSGREFAAQVTRKRPDIKIMYMSGYTDSAVVNSGILQKEVAFLQKPFTPGSLSDKVRDVLEDGNRTRRASE